MTLPFLPALVRTVGLLAGLSGLAGCTFAAENVEPALPAVPVFGSNTVAYQLDGRPVVAHNPGGTLFSVFGGSRAPAVDLYVGPDSTLIVRSAEEQNEHQPGYAVHALEWELRRFRGAGRYAPVPAGTTFERRTYDAEARYAAPGPVQQLDAAQPAEVVVTEWDASIQRVRGTFRLRFAARDGAPAAVLSEGVFDLKPNF